jgi:hypothetical protein
MNISAILLSFTIALSNGHHLPVVAQRARRPKYSIQFFTRQLEHNVTTSPTFQQQYQLDTEFFKPGRPVLFAQEVEVETMVCVEQINFIDWAEELGAIVATLEHRCMGASFPDGLDASNAYSIPGAFDGVPNNTQKYNWWNWVQLSVIPSSTTQANPQADL